jgi:hypothetical protein
MSEILNSDDDNNFKSLMQLISVFYTHKNF